jgi:hypothetical protein
MDHVTAELLTHDVIPAVRVLLRETTELRGAVQLLADRVESLTTELAEGDLHELARLAGQAVRALDTANGGRRP